MAILTNTQDKLERGGPDAPKRYQARYLGLVRDNLDPERRGRVRVHCPEVMGEVDSPDTWLGWAESEALGAGYDQGLFFVPPMPEDTTRDPGDSTSPFNEVRVWVQFRDGDPSKPIYSPGGPWIGGEEILNHVPILTDVDNNGDETVSSPNFNATSVKYEASYEDGTLNSGTEVREPLPSTQSVYPRNRVFKTGAGHVVEFDDSPGAERIKIFHPSGSYMEINQAGTFVQRTTGKHVEFVTDEKFTTVRGPSTEVHQDTQHLQVDRSSTNIYRDSRVVVTQKGEQRYNRAGLSHEIAGFLDYTTGNFRVQSAGNVDLVGGSSANLGGEEVNVQAVNAHLLGTNKMEVIGVKGVNLIGSVREPSHKIYASGDIDDIIDVLMTVFNTATGVLDGVLAPITPPGPAPASAVLTWAKAVQSALVGIQQALANNKTVHEATKL